MQIKCIIYFCKLIKTWLIHWLNRRKVFQTYFNFTLRCLLYTVLFLTKLRFSYIHKILILMGFQYFIIGLWIPIIFPTENILQDYYYDVCDNLQEFEILTYYANLHDFFFNEKFEAVLYTLFAWKLQLYVKKMQKNYSQCLKNMNICLFI